MNTTRFLVAIVATVLAAAALASDRPSNKWRVEFSEGAKSDGTITLEFSPEGASSFEISIAIADGTGENKVARTVAEELQKRLPAEQYHVEVDDGEDVLIKKKHGTPDFGLRIVANSVKAVRINLDRE